MKKFDNFSKALDNLIGSSDYQPPYTPTIQAGIVALFKICYEQAWKMTKELLEYHGLNPDEFSSPRPITKLAFQHKMINDQKTWLDMLDSRNELTHTYSEEDSFEAINKIRTQYVPLFIALRTEVLDKWLPEKQINNP